MSDLQYVDVMFGPYLPDLGGAPNADTPGYLTDALGVRLTPSGYRGLPVFADIAGATAIGSDVILNQGWQCSAVASRNYFVLSNNDGKIYESVDDGTTWVDVTPVAGAAPAFPGDLFTFETDVIFVCASRAAISKVLTTGTGTKFAAMAGSPPTAQCGARVRQHVILGGLTGVDNYAVQSSAIGDNRDWPTPGTADAVAKESFRESLPQELGIVTKILGGEKIGIAVQRGGLTRMTYEGGDTVYSFDTYETSIGSGLLGTAPQFCSDGKIWYWPHESGIFATDGYSVNRISDGSIEDAIFNNLLSHPQAVGTSASLQLINGQSSYDPHRHLAVFGSGSGTTYQLCYDVTSGAFTWMNTTTATSALFTGDTASTTLKISGKTLHNVNLSNRKLQRLSADGATLALQTGYIEVDPGYSVQLQGAHLLGAGVPGSLSLAYKAAANYAACDVSQSGFTTLTANTRGMKSTGRSSSQFFSFRATGTGSEAQLIRGIRMFFTRADPST